MRQQSARGRSTAWLAALAVILAPATAFAADTGFHSRQRGVVILGSVDLTPVGDALLGHVGGEWSEITTRDGGKWLLQWDGLVTVTGGLLGQTHPYTPMLGVRASGFFEGGMRLHPAAPWSLYLGGRASLEGVLMPPWGTGLGALDTVNNVAGVGGAGLGGGLRLAAGASWLSGRTALLATALVGESGRVPETNRVGAAFTDVGAMVRFDVAGSWLLAGEVRWGTTPALHHAKVDYTDQTTHLGVSLDLRKIFGNGMWLGLRLTHDGESDFLHFAASGASYHTVSAPMNGALILYGIGIGPQ
jgi:hypothetical protein